MHLRYKQRKHLVLKGLKAFLNNFSADLCSKCDIDATCKDGRCLCNEGFKGNGFTCKKSSTTVTDISTVSTPHSKNFFINWNELYDKVRALCYNAVIFYSETDSSCDYCPENGQCLDNVCVCPPGFENRKRSCVGKHAQKP